MPARFIPVHHPQNENNGTIPESSWSAHEAKGWKKGHKPEFTKIMAAKQAEAKKKGIV